MKKSTRLKELILRPKIVVLPGTANCFEAKMMQAAGFEACYMSGGRTALGLCGLPDAGLVSLTEMVTNARYIASAIDIPLLSDADTGYGNAVNVRHAVQQFIAAGVAGIHIEDQVSPKRCGFVAGKEVISIDEAVSKYRAAVDARNELDPDFVIISRTDSRGAAGGTLEEAIRRAKAYREAGADVAYVEALKSVEEVKRCVEEVGKPIMITLTAMWDRRAEEMPTHEQMEEMGLACAFYPGLAIEATYRLTWEFLCDVRDRGVAALREWKGWENAFHWKYGPPPGFHDLAGFPQVREWEEKYLSAEAMQKYLRSEGRYAPGES